MNTNFWSQDLDSLKALHATCSKELEAALLEGMDWKQLEEKRRLVTQLSIVIDRRTKGIPQNPAEL